MTAILCGIFFLSGVSALIFETLWFHQAGLVFGNGVWASSLVLAAFMAGLALGNGAVARLGHRVRRPVRFYAGLELVIAASGVAIVWGLPWLIPLLVPVLQLFVDVPALANATRLATGFVVMLVPATAMGATLPVLVKALLARDPSFGSVLGRLYGWNTLGAVVGALAGEAVLLESFGVRGSALVAASLNVLVGAVGLGLSRAFVPAGPVLPAADAVRVDTATRRLLAAAFLSGFALLALEVVWFRFLTLRVHGSSLVFAVMLAVVLLGIALGGFAGGAVLRRWPGAHRHVPVVSLLAGVLVVALYGAFEQLPVPAAYAVGWAEVAKLSIVLMLPVAVLSGVAFTGIGAAIGEQVTPPTRAAGWMTLWNTLGSAAGSLVAGFVLLPFLGMERSIFVLAVLYGGVAALAWPAAATARQRAPALVATVGFGLALVAFPFGLMESFLRVPLERFSRGGEVAVMREGRTETVLYVRHRLFGEPFQHRLITDGYSMSSTAAKARRYMKLYVWLPVALHPEPKRALLISYGVGSTAKALTDTASLEHIDVVDLSREILEESDVVFPDPDTHPLRDPRVHVHVEDGRQFLQTTTERYDLITGEPPPPKNAGVVSLYTREYFQLVRERLAPGGIHTYWIPIHSLNEPDVGAIVRAYCDVFPDCSLWSATGGDWMLMGSRDASYDVGSEHLLAQWNEPEVAVELEAVGLGTPELLGAAFAADADWLDERTRGVAPLVDDHPKRLSDAAPDPWAEWAAYWAWVDPEQARERFRTSPFIAAAWPEELREDTLPFFDVQRDLLVRTANFSPWRDEAQRMAALDTVLRETDLVGLPLLYLGISADHVARLEELDADERRSAAALSIEGRRLIAVRDYEGAARVLRRARAMQPKDAPLAAFLAYALHRSGRHDEARTIIRGASGGARDASGFAWLQGAFGEKAGAGEGDS